MEYKHSRDRFPRHGNAQESLVSFHQNLAINLLSFGETQSFYFDFRLLNKNYKIDSDSRFSYLIIKQSSEYFFLLPYDLWISYEQLLMGVFIELLWAYVCLDAMVFIKAYIPPIILPI